MGNQTSQQDDELEMNLRFIEYLIIREPKVFKLLIDLPFFRRQDLLGSLIRLYFLNCSGGESG